MKTYYALVARGKYYVYTGGGSFRARNSFMKTEADNRVQAFLQIYQELRKSNSHITARKTKYQDYMLGFSAEEWNEILKRDCRVEEGFPVKAGVQIQAIRDSPFTFH